MAILKSICGDDFFFRTEDIDNVSVLSGGYIINQDGFFIDVKDSENHSDIFTNYLREYLSLPNYGIVDTLTGSLELTNYNHIVYLGVKEMDVKEGYSFDKNISDEVILLFPSDVSKITKEAASSCLKLISTNKSFFGNYEKVYINYHNFSSKDDIKDIIIPILMDKANELSVSK